MNALLRAALFYASRGWHVFPVTPHQKAPPLVRWRTEASINADTIKNWWHDAPEANIGIATGKASGLVVLDVDGQHGGEESLLSLPGAERLPATPESLTGNGRHLLFAWPRDVQIGNSAGALGPGLDVRAEGGYIIAPPSVHPSGREYVWEASGKPSQTPLAPLPIWLLKLLTTTVAITDRLPDADSTLIREGGRNQALASLAGTMRRRGMSPEAITAALLAENEARCSPSLPTDEVMRIAGNIARYTVRPGEDVVAETKQPPPQEMMPSWQVAEQFVHLLCNLDGRSIQTHITSLDRAIGGLERQTLTVLCARPGMGKTALAWQIARNVAAAGNKVCFFSLEMGAANLWARAACGALGLRWRDVRGGNVAPQDLDRLATTARTLAGKYGGALLLSDRTVDTPQIMQLIEHHHPDLVVVDHIRLLADRNESEVKRLGLVTQRLKELAKAFDCSVLALAQLNRGVEGRDNKRPTLADLRDSGEIEENADLVLALYRPDYYAPEAGPVVVSDTEVLVRKFRDDVNAQKIVLQFDPARQWFDARVMPARSSGSNGRQPEPEYEPVSA